MHVTCAMCSSKHDYHINSQIIYRVIIIETNKSKASFQHHLVNVELLSISIASKCKLLTLKHAFDDILENVIVN